MKPIGRWLDGILIVLTLGGIGLLLAVRNSEQALLWHLTGCGVACACLGALAARILGRTRKILQTRREAGALRRKNEAAEALNQQLQQMAHHQRLEIIGTLTSSIAHEFNNLLVPIMGYSMLALEQISPEQEELYDNVLEVYHTSLRAKTIISRLSDLSRKNGESHVHPVSPDDLIHKSLDVAMPAKPDNVEVKLGLNCQDQKISANEIQINQMLLNLMLNGFCAMEPQGGVLYIGTSFDEENVIIRVEDRGCGMEEEILPRIFEPFFTTKESGKGTGLGLAIVAQVVEDHRGHIEVESKVGVGTRFTVRLPRFQETDMAR